MFDFQLLVVRVLLEENICLHVLSITTRCHWTVRLLCGAAGYSIYQSDTGVQNSDLSFIARELTSLSSYRTGLYRLLRYELHVGCRGKEIGVDCRS